MPGEPHNPAGYAGVLAAAGFAPAATYVTQLGAPRGAGDAAGARRAVRAAGYRVEPLDGAAWAAMLPALHQAADEIFGGNLAYTPLPYAAFAAAYGAPVARRLCPRTSVVAWAPDGALAGFALVYPHYGPLLAQGAPGGPVPADALSFAEHAPALARLGGGGRTAVARTVGVAAAHRRRGLLTAMGAAVLERGRAHYDRWIAALIRADNPSRRFGAPRARAERTYALYARPLDGRPLDVRHPAGGGHA
jgi:GNAT superfamily N-acetyltransferase